MKNIFEPRSRGEVASPLNGSLLALGILILVIIFVASGVRPAAAQSGGLYDLTWNTFDGGGANLQHGGADLARRHDRAGGCWDDERWRRQLSGGFWVDFLGNKISLPFIAR